jgi:hypothetical protein
LTPFATLPWGVRVTIYHFPLFLTVVKPPKMLKMIFRIAFSDLSLEHSTRTSGRMFLYVTTSFSSMTPFATLPLGSEGHNLSFSPFPNGSKTSKNVKDDIPDEHKDRLLIMITHSSDPSQTFILIYTLVNFKIL